MSPPPLTATPHGLQSVEALMLPQPLLVKEVCPKTASAVPSAVNGVLNRSTRLFPESTT